MTKTYKFNGAFNGTVVPMFMPTKMEQPMVHEDPTHNKNDASQQEAELSVFDVKELYDLAYTYKDTDQIKFKSIMGEAVKLDMQYRQQIEKKTAHTLAKSDKADHKTNHRAA